MNRDYVSSDDFRSFKNDLARLKRENRALKISVVIISSIVFAMIILAGAPVRQNVVRTERLEIVDSNGNVRAELDSKSGEGPTLNLIDPNDICRVRLNIVDDKIPRLTFFDKQGRPRELLGVSSDGAAVKLFDQNGIMRAIFGLYDDGSNGVVLSDENGVPSGAFCSDSDGNAALKILKEK
ncbi:MAG: hypothetical protein ABIC40_00835 [bacterium]